MTYRDNPDRVIHRNVVGERYHTLSGGVGCRIIEYRTGKTLQIIPPHHGADFNDDNAIRAAIDRHIKQRR